MIMFRYAGPEDFDAPTHRSPKDDRIMIESNQGWLVLQRSWEDGYTRFADLTPDDIRGDKQ